MKWLKHMTASWDDEKLASLVGEGGPAGLARYGLYWRINEIIASKMEGKDPSCSVQYPVTRWSTLLSVRGSLVRQLLGQLPKNGLLTVEWIGTEIRVTNCNLLKYRDEYSQKSRQTPVQALEGDTELDTDTDTEEEKTKASGDKNPPPPEPTVFDLPLVDKSEYSLPQSLFNEYVNAYPGVSVMAELAAMRSWILSNPREAKTRKGITRFMNSWLSRSQNNAARNGHGGKSNGRTNGKSESVQDVLRELGAQGGANRNGGGGVAGKHGQAGKPAVDEVVGQTSGDLPW